MIRLLLIDTHPFFQRAISSIVETVPDWSLQAIASDGLNALTLLQQQGLPDVVLINRFYNNEGPDGLEIAQFLHRHYPGIELVLFTPKRYPGLIRQAHQAGVRGVIDKHQAYPDLIYAMEAIIQGGTYGMDLTDDESNSHPLSPTQQQLMRAIAQGHSWTYIASHLHLRLATVQTLRQVLMDRLEVTSEQSLKRYAKQLYPMG